MIKSQWKSIIKGFNDHSIVPENEWEENTRANIKRLHKTNSVWRMEGMLKSPDDKAVIIIGASPCLKRDVDKLKACTREDFVIVCVNSALQFVLKHGIKPDYVIAIDSDDEDIFKHLDVKENDIPLITCNILSPRVLDAWKGKIWYFPYFAVSAGLKKRLRSRLGKGVPVGGNALGSMAAIAISVWQARIIIFVGSECCYDKDYYPTKKIARNNLPATEFFITDINGKKRVTTTPLHTYKLWLERLALGVQPMVKIIDTSEGILGKRDEKSYIYTYELSEIIEKVKEAVKKKKEILKHVEGDLSNAALYPQGTGKRVSVGSR